MSRWFRFYDDALNDPKAQRLDGETFKLWVNILCVASRNEGRLPPIADLAFALRIDENACETVVERLRNGGLIATRNGGANGSFYAPHKWEERQYKSDTSTSRVKRFRERSKTVSETPPDTDTETDNIPPTPRKRGNDGKHLIPKDWEAPPVEELPPQSRACAAQWSKASYLTEAEAFHCYWLSERKMKSDWKMTWANRIVARHSAVMRDQKFGNAPPETPGNDRKPLTTEELERAIRFRRDHGDEDGARKYEAELAERRAA